MIARTAAIPLLFNLCHNMLLFVFRKIYVMKRILVISFVILVLVFGTGVWYWHHQHQKTVNPKTPTTLVMVTKAKIEIVPKQVRAIGQVIAPETTVLKTQSAGVVTHLYFKSGQFVKKNQLLMQIDPTEAKAAVAQQYANYTNLNTQYQRLLKLAKISKGDVTADQLSQAKNNTLAAKAQWQDAKKLLSNTQVRAPFSGVIGVPQAILNQIALGGGTVNETEPLTVGSYLSIGSPIAILSNNQNILVQYQVPEIYSAAIKIGQPVTVRFLSFPKRAFLGNVTYISPIVYQNTQAYNVQARIRDPNHVLRSGMNASITQTINPNRRILTVPGLALVPSLSGYSVYTVDSSKVKAVPVTIGERFKDLVAIKAGLKPGDIIIANGSLNAQPGMTVKVQGP